MTAVEASFESEAFQVFCGILLVQLSSLAWQPAINFSQTSPCPFFTACNMLMASGFWRHSWYPSSCSSRVSNSSSWVTLQASFSMRRKSLSGPACLSRSLTVRHISKYERIFLLSGSSKTLLSNRSDCLQEGRSLVYCASGRWTVEILKR